MVSPPPPRAPSPNKVFLFEALLVELPFSVSVSMEAVATVSGSSCFKWLILSLGSTFGHSGTIEFSLEFSFDA